MYSDLILGNTCSLKAAQCGQVIEAYSVMVTAASFGPSAMSGSDTGLATSPAAACAMASGIMASEMNRSGENPASAASPGSDSIEGKARRGGSKGGPPSGGGSPQNSHQKARCEPL